MSRDGEYDRDCDMCEDPLEAPGRPFEGTEGWYEELCPSCYREARRLVRNALGRFGDSRVIGSFIGPDGVRYRIYA